MKIEVKICMGTTCYVMGGAELATLSEHLTPGQLEYVEIKGIPCIDACFDQKTRRAPYAMVGNILIDKASIEKIKEELNKQIIGFDLK